ncbi:hypothetical protein [Mycoplasma parvum]|uniref:Uncharacterized protein n=1 Tax=Mycoplasma parvum str. Indiana TaxID=1403316 RepID=U5NFJ7_9MOLU|nr:hypothetical protein [Mycoplasma parvum]AGX89003.1 hypothetical protein PRV_01205 [Mycoplasma parvum str. Indiana]
MKFCFKELFLNIDFYSNDAWWGAGLAFAFVFGVIIGWKFKKWKSRRRK